MITRRTSLKAIAAGLTVLHPAVVLAHDGHDTSGPSITVLSAQSDDTVVWMTLLVVLGRATQARLDRLFVAGGEVTAPQLPVVLEDGTTRVVVDAILRCDGPAPALFTLIAEFEHHGTGPVTVIPT